MASKWQVPPSVCRPLESWLTASPEASHARVPREREGLLRVSGVAKRAEVPTRTVRSYADVGLLRQLARAARPRPGRLSLLRTRCHRARPPAPSREPPRPRVTRDRRGSRTARTARARTSVRGGAPASDDRSRSAGPRPLVDPRAARRPRGERRRLYRRALPLPDTARQGRPHRWSQRAEEARVRIAIAGGARRTPPATPSRPAGGSRPQPRVRRHGEHSLIIGPPRPVRDGATFTCSSARRVRCRV